MILSNKPNAITDNPTTLSSTLSLLFFNKQNERLTSELKWTYL